MAEFRRVGTFDIPPFEVWVPDKDRVNIDIHDGDGVTRVALSVEKARQLRDWLTTALPADEVALTLQRGGMIDRLLKQRDAGWEALRRIAAMHPQSYLTGESAVTVAQNAFRGSPAQYYCRPGEWCSNPNHADMFTSSEEAWIVAAKMKPTMQPIRVVDHIWIGSQADRGEECTSDHAAQKLAGWDHCPNCKAWL